MILDRVMDLSFSLVQDTDYDLAVFASGYEPRCTYIASKLKRRAIRRSAVCGFADFRDVTARQVNDSFFAAGWLDDQLGATADDDAALYLLLRSLSSRRSHHILVDYSSMSRTWYSAVLSWARNLSSKNPITIDFVYSVGNHVDLPKSRPPVIKDILAVPGCEGGAIRLGRAVAVFGLGFDGEATLCAHDLLEPDLVYAYYASPVGYPKYEGVIPNRNKVFLERHSPVISPLVLPLESMSQTFVYLAELIAPHRLDSDILFVPMGPKPQVLASILLACRFREITCLHVSLHRSRPEEVKPLGAIVGARVTFR